MAEIFDSLATTLVDTFKEATFVLPELIVLIAALIAPLVFYLTKNGKIVAAVSFALIAVSALVTMLLMHTVTYGVAASMF